MADAADKPFTLADLRRARAGGAKVPMLTCYDFTTAGLMAEAGVPMLLVGDSAANVILGHPSTLPVSLDFLIDLTAAVRRGAPGVLLIGDMPFGSYGAGVDSGFANACRLVRETGCDAVKLEATDGHAALVRTLADAGLAVVAHLGLRPQAVGLMGGYRYQGRTAAEARRVVQAAKVLADAGAAAVLLEAVPPEVAEAVVKAVGVPVIGCGAGPACHGHVVVTPDLLGLTPRRPRFVPTIEPTADGGFADQLRAAFAAYARMVRDGTYPAAEHAYAMPPDERRAFTETAGRPVQLPGRAAGVIG